MAPKNYYVWAIGNSYRYGIILGRLISLKSESDYETIPEHIIEKISILKDEIPKIMSMNCKSRKKLLEKMRILEEKQNEYHEFVCSDHLHIKARMMAHVACMINEVIFENDIPINLFGNCELWIRILDILLEC